MHFQSVTCSYLHTNDIYCTYSAHVQRYAMATITKLPSGKWRVQVRKRGHYASRTFHTKGQADTWARKIEMRIDNDEHIADDTSLSDLLDRYLKEVTPAKKGADRERRRILQLQSDPIAQETGATVTSEVVTRYRDRRLETVSGETVRKELALLSDLFKVARGEWHLPLGNPVEHVRRPPPAKSRDRRLTWSELRMLLRAADKQKNRQIGAIIRLGYLTGMRQSEILALRWEWIDFNDAVALLPDTKNGDARAIPLGRRAVRLLERLQPDDLDDHEEPEGPIFSYTSDGFRSIWHRMTRAVGLTDIRFHDLRHEATSRFFEAGLNPMEVASITGHRTLAMLKRYTHLRAKELAERLR